MICPFSGMVCADPSCGDGTTCSAFEPIYEEPREPDAAEIEQLARETMGYYPSEDDYDPFGRET